MRIAQLVETLGTGGAEKLAVEIARNRGAAGDQSHLIVLTGPGPLSSLVPPSIVQHHLGLDPANPLSLIRTMDRLRALCRRLELQVVQTHLPMANFFGLGLTYGGGPGVFPTVHNNREFSYGDAAHPLRSRFRRFAYRKLVGRGQAMIAVSGAVKAAMVAELGLLAADAARLVVVPNGVEVPALLEPGVRDQVRREYGVGPEDIMIVGVGRLSEQKNFGDLVAALAKIQVTDASWRCVIAGTGGLEEDLARLIHQSGLDQKVILAGHVARVDLLLGAADIFCLSSLWEGLPLALLEAMAAGLPVAAYAIDGVVELVEHRSQGLIATAGDVDGLAEALGHLASDKALRVSLGAAGRELVGQRHGMDVVGNRLGELYARFKE